MEDKKKISLRSRPPLPSEVPWLVLPSSRKDGEDQTFYNLLEPCKRNCIKRIPELSGNTYWQSHSHEGWLVILSHDEWDCFLWNPVTLEKIMLPNLLKWFDPNKNYISDCVLTSPPSSNYKNSTMVFFLFGSDESEVLLVYCRPGDKGWKSQKLLSGNINGDEPIGGSLVCFKSNLYILFDNCWHLEIKIEKQLGVYADESLSMRPFSITRPPSFSKKAFTTSLRALYVVSSDELFKVIMNYDSRELGYCSYKSVISIEVSRLNSSLMAWEALQSLDDHVLFLGQNTTAYCSAAKLSFTRGCVYYTLIGDQSLYKYDLEGQSVSVSLPFLKPTMPHLSPGWVMMPPPVRACDGRTENIFVNGQEDDNILHAQEKNTKTNNGLKEAEGPNKNGVQLEEAKEWGILNTDIFELIASYLPPVDYLHFRAISKGSRSLLPAAKWRFLVRKIDNEITSLSPLLFFSESNGAIYNYVDPEHNNEKYLTDSHTILSGATICYSNKEWLLMSKGWQKMFFYNPFTKAAIQLPGLPQEQSYVYLRRSFVSSPTSSDCVVFAITVFVDHEDLKEKILAGFITRGQNEWWLGIYPKSDVFTPCLISPVFCNGAFYSLDHNGSLGVFETDGGSFKEIVPDNQQGFNSDYQKFLVEHEGKLLLVDIRYLGMSIRVFRFDFSSESWVKVENLGKHMMFVSNASSTSAIAPNSSMENKIYLPRLDGEGILCYSLETGNCHSVGGRRSTKGFSDSKALLNSTWILPNCTRTTTTVEEELGWCHV